jgi:hypothetical protein
MSSTDPELIRGRGAWSTLGKDNGSRYYCYLSRMDMDGRRPESDLHHFAVNRGVRAIQIRLNTLGFSIPLVGEINVNGKFGYHTKLGVKWFQKNRPEASGLAVDGVVGPTTAQALWMPLVNAIGMRECSRPDILYGMTSLESAFDPGAVSSLYKPENGPDFGLCQINLHFNPHVTVTQAFTPRYALTWSASRFNDAMNKYDGKGIVLQTNCAIAHHNSPVQADTWYETGVPPTDQIERYVELVLERASHFPISE